MKLSIPEAPGGLELAKAVSLLSKRVGTLERDRAEDRERIRELEARLPRPDPALAGLLVALFLEFESESWAVVDALEAALEQPILLSALRAAVGRRPSVQAVAQFLARTARTGSVEAEGFRLEKLPRTRIGRLYRVTAVTGPVTTLSSARGLLGTTKGE